VTVTDGPSLERGLGLGVSVALKTRDLNLNAAPGKPESSSPFEINRRPGRTRSIMTIARLVLMTARAIFELEGITD
jgi:hypothetical protein